MSNATILASALTICLTAGANADEIRSTPDQQTGVAVTIYNENLALVKDRRSLQLPLGQVQLAFRGVSARMRAETAMLRNVDAPDSLSVIEQNFDFDLLTPQSLLQKYTGKEVRVARMNPATGVETIEQATVLSTNNGVVLKIGDRIETNPGGRMIFDDVPANLRDQPTLSIQLQNSNPAPQQVELSYLTGGLGWKADYVAELAADDSELELMGWVTLTNNSGAAYHNATMQLVAGDVNQVRRPRANKAMLERSMMMAAEADDGMAEESLFEYHLYTLGRPTSIADKQTKQVALLAASSIPVVKELVLQGHSYYYHSSHGDIGQKMKLGVYVQFNNEKADGLGMPLPKGIVRVYKRDSMGNAQFIGEDAIDHTPNRETVRLKLGEAFDVTADKKQTDFQLKERVVGSNLIQSSFEIRLKNAKTESVSVIVREPIPGDWEILNESAAHRKVAAGTAEWRIEVPAEGSTTLSYTTRVKF